MSSHRTIDFMSTIIRLAVAVARELKKCTEYEVSRIFIRKYSYTYWGTIEIGIFECLWKLLANDVHTHTRARVHAHARIEEQIRWGTWMKFIFAFAHFPRLKIVRDSAKRFAIIRWLISRITNSVRRLISSINTRWGGMKVVLTRTYRETSQVGN